MHKKYTISIAVFLLILLVYCCTYYHGLIFQMPSGIHSWAQADRLSLAVNFYDNGMNFFKPVTNSLYSEQGVTGVEFPIQAYLAALGGKIFGREYISICFRLLNTIISCTGLLFLFLAGYKATKDFIVSLVTPLFVFCSPVFIYYTCNYLPDTAAASIAFIAFYYILRYADSLSAKHFIRVVFFLTLATLMKTSVGIYLCGFLLWVLLSRAKDDEQKSESRNPFYISTLISIAAIVGYYFYNRYLNAKYHSGIFLATVNPFRGFSDVSIYLDSFKKMWAFEYLLPIQYLLLMISTAIALPTLFKSKTGKNLLLLTLIFLLGVLAMVILIGRQLSHHDYYFASILLPLSAFVLLVSVNAIFNSITTPIVVLSLRAGCVAIILFCFVTAGYHTHHRLKNGVAGFNPGTSWAEGGADVLRYLQVPKDDPIMIVNEDAPNTELLFFDRKGINIDRKQWQHANALADLRPQMWEFDNMRVLVCESGLAKNILATDTTVAVHFNTLYLKGRIAVFRRK